MSSLLFNNKVLLCGLGSIGSRHLKNLQMLGCKDLIIYTKNSNPYFKSPPGIQCYDILDEALKQKPIISIICNPTSFHIKTAIECAKAGSHIFIEKPVSHDLENVAELSRVLKSKNIFCMIGYMMRFNPAIKLIKSHIKNGELGTPIHFSSVWGEYLPDWHPYEDYLISYASKKNLGGGLILTLSHDIDLAYWFFGMPQAISCTTLMASNLSIDTESVADIIFKYNNVLTAHLHLNYIDKPTKRNITIRFSNGRIDYDIMKNILFLYRGYTKENEPEIFDYNDKFTRNDLFELELKYFLESINNNSEPSPSFEDGINVLKLAIAASKSAAQGPTIKK